MKSFGLPPNILFTGRVMCLFSHSYPMATNAIASKTIWEVQESSSPPMVRPTIGMNMSHSELFFARVAGSYLPTDFRILVKRKTAKVISVTSVFANMVQMDQNKNKR